MENVSNLVQIDDSLANIRKYLSELRKIWRSIICVSPRRHGDSVEKQIDK